MKIDALLLTCEHGGHHVPARYRTLFAGREGALLSHRGYDDGALELARALRRGTGAPLVAATTTRLLVDLNRPASESSVFSEVTRVLPKQERERLLAEHHRPHWRKVQTRVESVCGRRGRILHVACHSFTPVRDGKVRRTDLGLLFDPRRPVESRVCQDWVQALREALPGLFVHRNMPYRGWSPGLTTSLRGRWSSRLYLGVEIEMNQRLSSPDRRRVQRALLATLGDLIGPRDGASPARRRRLSGAARRSSH